MGQQAGRHILIHAELGKYGQRKSVSQSQAKCGVSEVHFHFSLLQESEKPHRTHSFKYQNG